MPNRPIKRLFGFDKVMLEPNETKTVTLKVDIPDIAYFDEAANKFAVDTGSYQVQVGGSSASVALTGGFTVTGAITPQPKFVTAKPNQNGDDSKQIAERLIFGKGRTVMPNIAVAMNDESLYGRTIAENVPGQVGVPHIADIPLPAGAVVSYTSNRPDVVSVDDGVISTVKAGVATITATVTYNGKSASGDFVVYVQSDAMPEEILVDGVPLQGYAKDRANYSIAVDYSETEPKTVSVVSNGNPTASWTVEQADGIPGIARVVGTDAETGRVDSYIIGFGRPPISSDFKDAGPGVNWSVAAPDPANVELGDNGLTIRTASGGALGSANPVKNVYMQQAAGDWVAKAHITLSAAPTVNNQQAGLVIYDDDSNYIRFVYERPTGVNTVFRVYRVTDGASAQISTLTLANLTDYYMQVVKSGDDYTFYYGAIGKTDTGEPNGILSWTRVGNAALNARFALPQIGLWANNGATNAAPIEATYEYLEIYDLEDASPYLEGITINGEPLTDFDPSRQDYTRAAADFADVPVIDATPARDFTVSVEQADKLPGKAVIKVSSGIADNTYYVIFDELPTGDSFVDGTRDDKWVILNELESEYSIEKGKGLRLPTQNGDVYQTNRLWNNAFIRPGGGSWEVVAKVLYPQIPNANYQQIMLLVWQDEDNYIKLDCETAALTLQAAAERNGGVGKFGGGNATPNPDGTVTMYFRIKKDGDEYTCSYSKDGLNYTVLGSTEFHMVDTQIGLFATKNSGGTAVIDTYCEYIDVTGIGGVDQKSYMQMLQDAADNVMEYVVDDLPSSVGGGQLELSPVPHGYTVAFDSSNTAVIDNDGIVKPSRDGEVDVELGIAISDGFVTANSTVTLTVEAAKLHNVSFDSVGGTAVEAQQVYTGDAAAVPDEPTMEGYKFEGWFVDGEDAAYDFSAPVYGDLALIAKWKKLATFVKIHTSTRISIKLRDNKAGYQLMKSTDLVGDEYVYTSSNPGIARVDADGLVTPVRAGVAVISIRLTDGSELVSSATVNITP
jgi:uncharacterized repeat protein (TIGR02543 family)